MVPSCRVFGGQGGDSGAGSKHLVCGPQQAKRVRTPIFRRIPKAAISQNALLERGQDFTSGVSGCSRPIERTVKLSGVPDRVQRGYSCTWPGLRETLGA